MLSTATPWQGYHRTMSPNSFRLAIVVAVVIVSLLGVIAFATVLASELTDRSVLVLGVILGFLGPTIVSLLNLLRTDAVSAKVEDTASKVGQVQEFVENGGLRDSVKRAMHEVEADPVMQRRRIETTAKGVSKDRHDKANSDTIAINRAELDELRRRASQGGPRP
jgi:predicted RNA-binding protein